MNESVKFPRWLFQYIRTTEKFVSPAAPCPSGVPTGGYGHTRGVKNGDVVSVEQAEKWLSEDCAEARAAILRLVKVPLTSNQLGALTSFVFNLGSGALAQSTLLRMLNARQYENVPAQMMRWRNATVDGKLTEMPGLVKRRKYESTLWSTPDETETP